MADDLGAVAITSRYSQADAVARALGAGNDLLVFANQADYVPDLAARLIETIAGLVASGRVSSNLPSAISESPVGGPAACLAGSCSQATLGQIARAGQAMPVNSPL